MPRLLQYAISNRTLFTGNEHAQQSMLIEQAVALGGRGVDYFQVREKDLDAATLLTLTRAIRDAVYASGSRMQIVLNGPLSVAKQAGVGWHRSSSSDYESEAPCLSCSVHDVQAVQAERERSALLLFAPVFHKTLADGTVLPGSGLDALRTAVQHADAIPVFALGGVTQQNAKSCMDAGAAGIAGIRLYLP